MADIEIVEKNDSYDFDIEVYDPDNRNADGSPKLISFSDLGITQGTLTIRKTDFSDSPPTLSKTVSLPNNYTARLEIVENEVPPNDEYYAQILFNDASGALKMRTYPYMTVKVARRLDA